MRLFRRSLVAFVVALAIAPAIARSQWKLIHRFPSPINSVYFANASTGFVGLGIVPGGSTVAMQIFATRDGGSTWTECTVPSGTGSVTRVLMLSDKEGYAAVQPWPSSVLSALWKTTDGGVSWVEFAGPHLLGSDLAVTPSTMMMSDLFGDGLVSTDGGVFWKQTSDFSRRIGLSFVDDRHGVATCYKHAGRWTYTVDGGRTWQDSDFGDEGWGVWGRPGTSLFFAAPELSSDLSSANSPVLRSTDYGATWKNVTTLAFRTTGALFGAGNDLYVQGCAVGSPRGHGIYHSTDDGATWIAIGGPSALNDTRAFVLQSCGTNVIFAADSIGGLWALGATSNPRYVSSSPDPAHTFGYGETVPVNLTPVLPASTALPVSAITVSIDAAFDPTLLEPQLSQTTANAGWQVSGTTIDGDLVHVTFSCDARSIATRSFQPGTIRFKAINFGSLTVRLKAMTVQTSQSPLVYCANEEGNALAIITIDQVASVTADRETDFITRLTNRSFRIHGDRVRQVSLYDEAGRIVETPQLVDGEVQITAPSGIYFLRVKDSGVEKTVRIAVLP